MTVSLDRVWLFDDPRSHGARSILRWAAQGLRRIGKTVHSANLKLNEANSNIHLRNELIEFGPTAVLLANHPAHQFWMQLGFDAPQCDSLVWLFDDPFLMGNEPFSPEEIILLSDPSFEEAAKNRGAVTTLFLPVAAPDVINAQNNPNLKSNVVYVGAAADLTAMRNALSNEMAVYFDSIAERQASQPSLSLDTLLTEYPLTKSKKVTLSGQIAYYIYANANRIHRMQYLQTLANQNLVLYGNEAWRKHIENTPLQSCFQGEIDPLIDYHNLICSVDINLNLRSLQGFSAPTHRDFLVPRLGGFMIASARSDRLSPAEIDPTQRFGFDRFPWAPQADSPEAIAFLVNEWLDKPAERKQWINHAAEVIEQQHLFSHRMKQLNDLLS